MLISKQRLISAVTGVVLGMLMAFAPISTPAMHAAPDSLYFSQTGYSVRSVFLTFFQTRGGLDIFGYPISDQYNEAGTRRLVQNFQRARFEYWPENPAPYKVQLSLLGQSLRGGIDPPVIPEKIPTAGIGDYYFAETGHIVPATFMTFFRARGGLDIFGYPISEMYLENGILVQYFQRARMELHPENPPAYRVQLGLIGQDYLRRYGVATTSQNPSPAPATTPTATSSCTSFSQTGKNVCGAFLDFFNKNGGLDLFGYPITNQYSSGSDATVQYFQRARMEYRPTNADPYKLQLGLIGQDLRGGIDPKLSTAAIPSGTQYQYFPQTGHVISNAFKDYYNAHGGLNIFGYPITEQFTENGVLVQYFQRARMEYYPNNPTRYRVLLGLLGQAHYDRFVANTNTPAPAPTNTPSPTPTGTPAPANTPTPTNTPLPTNVTFAQDGLATAQTNCNLTQVQGTIAVASGAGLGGQKIRITSNDGLFTQDTTSDNNGFYVFQLASSPQAGTWLIYVIANDGTQLSAKYQLNTPGTCNPGDANVVTFNLKRSS